MYALKFKSSLPSFPNYSIFIAKWQWTHLTSTLSPFQISVIYELKLYIYPHFQNAPFSQINGEEVTTSPHQYVVSLVKTSPDTIVMKVVTLSESKALAILNANKNATLKKNKGGKGWLRTEHVFCCWWICRSLYCSVVRNTLHLTVFCCCFSLKGACSDHLFGFYH